jgi:hypothetical protein
MATIMENNFVYLLIAVNSSFLSFWWGFQLGLSSFSIFSKYAFVFPLGQLVAVCWGRCWLRALAAYAVQSLQFEWTGGECYGEV